MTIKGTFLSDRLVTYLMLYVCYLTVALGFCFWLGFLSLPQYLPNSRRDYLVVTHSLV
jgi:hypothetical protein